MSLNVCPNITFARIWNLIKRACDYEYESIYHFPGSYVGRNMNDIKCMRCGKTATSLIYYNGLSIDVCGGCLFYYDSGSSFAYPRDNESIVDCGKKTRIWFSRIAGMHGAIDPRVVCLGHPCYDNNSVDTASYAYPFWAILKGALTIYTLWGIHPPTLLQWSFKMFSFLFTISGNPERLQALLGYNL